MNTRVRGIHYVSFCIVNATKSGSTFSKQSNHLLVIYKYVERTVVQCTRDLSKSVFSSDWLVLHSFIFKKGNNKRWIVFGYL